MKYDDDDNTINSYWKSKELDFDIPEEYKALRYLYVEGYMTENCVLSCNIYYNNDYNIYSNINSNVL